MNNIKFIIFLVFGIILGCDAACKDHSTCSECAGKSEFLFHCEWCVETKSCFLSLESSCNSGSIIPKEFDCPIDPDGNYKYSDDFARNIVLPYIGASFGDEQNQVQDCLDTHFLGKVLSTKLYTAVCDKDNNTCAAYLAVDKQNQAIVLTFAGTKGLSQLLDEGTDFLFNEMVAFPEVGGKIDKYYHNAYYILWQNTGILNDLKVLITQNPGFNFWTFGHSMGGSLASIASAHVVRLGLFTSDKVRLVTFGQPRTGDYDFAVVHDNLVKYRYRVVHNHDGVPHLPKQENPVDPPYHHRFEVWYPNAMQPGQPFSICERADDDSCSNAVNDDNTDDHLHYFNYNLPEWYKTKCEP